MKVIIQRVKESNVVINNEVYNSINNGLMVLVGFTHDDDSNDIDYIVKKIVNLRIFDDKAGVMNKSILDVGGSILSISQFTLYADTKKGNRPSYIKALSGEYSIKLYDEFNDRLSNFVETKTGIFGSDMKVSLVNNGPVTIIIDSKDRYFMNELKINGIYKHFKGDLYIVEDIAIDSETKGEMVVYRALYGNSILYVRDKEMFLSEVEHEKYPNVSQKYRFELQSINSVAKNFKSV